MHFVDLQASYASLGNQRGYFYTESDDTEYGKVSCADFFDTAGIA